MEANRTAAETLAALSSLTRQLGRCTDLDDVLTVSLDALAGLFGFEHSLLMMLDETGTTLFTIASRGYDTAGIGSEVRVGDGIIGVAAEGGAPQRIGNLQRMLLYARSARDADQTGSMVIALPGLAAANSQLAAPAIVMGHTLGVLAVESERLGAFTEDDEQLLAVVAHLVATAIELDRVGGPTEIVPGNGAVSRRPVEPVGTSATSSGTADRTEPTAVVNETSVVRFFPVDGSTFIDGEYLIKGVPGRILWRLLHDFQTTGRTEFTNREVRLDPSLDLPPFRDNLESRLILLKRRLDERCAPMRLAKTGRGRFRLVVTAPLRTESVDDVR